MYELIGYRRVDIEAERKNDRDTHGYSCWFSMDENDPEFTGRSACKVFFPDETYPDFRPALGDHYLLIFNQKGKLQGYQKIDNNGVLEDE